MIVKSKMTCKGTEPRGKESRNTKDGVTLRANYVAHYQTGTHCENREEEEVKNNITFLDLDLATSKQRSGQNASCDVPFDT